MKKDLMYFLPLIVLLIVDIIFGFCFNSKYNDYTSTIAYFKSENFLYRYVDDNGNSNNAYEYTYEFFNGIGYSNVKTKSNYGEAITVLYNPLNPDENMCLDLTLSNFSLGAETFLVVVMIVMIYNYCLNKELRKNKKFLKAFFVTGYVTSLHLVVVNYYINKYYEIDLQTTTSKIVSLVFFITMSVFLISNIIKNTTDEAYLQGIEDDKEEKKKRIRNQKTINMFKKKPYYGDFLTKILGTVFFSVVYTVIIYGFSDKNGLSIWQIGFMIIMATVMLCIIYFEISDFFKFLFFKNNLKKAIQYGETFEGQIICYCTKTTYDSDGVATNKHYLIVKYCDGVEKIMATPQLTAWPEDVLGSTSCTVYKYKNKEYVWDYTLKDENQESIIERDNSYMNLVDNELIRWWPIVVSFIINGIIFSFFTIFR